MSGWSYVDRYDNGGYPGAGLTPLGSASGPPELWPARDDAEQAQDAAGGRGAKDVKIKAEHNHPLQAFGRMKPPGECPRCDQRRAERAAEGLTEHNHEALPFGARKPPGECPRCDELHMGARPRLSRAERERRDDEQRAREIREHDCAVSGCAVVCTFGDW